MNTILMSDLLSGKDIDNIVSKAMLQKIWGNRVKLRILLVFTKCYYRIKLQKEYRKSNESAYL